MSARSLIKKYGQKITVKRDTNVESRVKGKRVDDIYKSFETTGSVQPMTSKEVLNESPGEQRVRDGIRVYSVERLLGADPETSLKSDLVVFEGSDYEVQRSNNWTKNKRNLAGSSN